MKKITIAIDGYSCCGKSTIAKALAAQLGYSYVDSGAMYRAITFFLIQKNKIDTNGNFNENEVLKCLGAISLSFKFNEEKKLNETFLNGQNVENEIRRMNVANNVSAIAKIREVRQKTIVIQRELGKNKGVVMDGRDIGTNVFPDAELKIFMTADADVRAKRRYDELIAKGETADLQEVKKNLVERDWEDTHRKENPLVQAEDAVVLDNTNLTREQQLEFAYNLAKGIIGK